MQALVPFFLLCFTAATCGTFVHAQSPRHDSTKRVLRARQRHDQETDERMVRLELEPLLVHARPAPSLIDQAKVRYWKALRKFSEDSVFNEFQVEASALETLRSPHTAKLAKVYPEPADRILLTDLVKAIAQAKREPLREADALALEAELMQGWLERGVPPTVLLHKFLGSAFHDRERALESASLGTIVAYIPMFNKANLTRAFSLAQWLTMYGKEHAVVAALHKAMDAPDLRDVAMAVRKDLVHMWFQDKTISTVDVAKKLQLVEPASLAFTHYKLETLEAYFKLARTRGETPDMLDVLLKAYNERDVVLVFSVAQDSALERQQQQLYARDLNVVFQGWYTQEIVPSRARSKLFDQVDTRMAPYVERILAKYTAYYHAQASEG
ncbi:hypothetical protein PsorP6_010265 [Peronosclerospora sorghi]|uniref:Uncharacterized protein n=1 Tax=Peronosclerospora sorghi TaxID=230839 RepID=A0ACC0VXF2_9STRA|nr:hypothetical protein PsorP6_010265 [Peronosclerospora sorghi]